MKKRNSLSVLITGIVFAFIMFTAGVLMLTLPLTKADAASAGNVSSDPAPLNLTPGSGSGTAQDPYVIGTAANMDVLLRNNAGTANKHFILMNNIDLGSFTNWNPITAFAAGGSLNGNGFAIENLTVARNGNYIGLFDDLRGVTIKNVVFKNARVNFSGTTARNHGGVVAARITSGTNIFDNITIEAGSSVGILANGNANNSGDHTFGGLVGAITGGNATFESCLNNANIKGSHYLGGMISRATGNNSNVVIRNSGNTGAITSSSTSNGYTGGLMGISEGISGVTIETSFNTGKIQAARGNTAGLLGSAWQGSALIKNSINDSEVTVTSGNQGSITTRNTAGVEIENTWYNNTLCTGAMTNGTTGIIFVNCGGAATATIRSNEWLEEKFGGAFVLRAGKITLSIFVPVYTYKFESGEGTGSPAPITQSVDDLTITLPYTNLPERIGYTFKAWRHMISGAPCGVCDDFEKPEAGSTETFTNHIDGNVTFEPVFEKITYTIEFTADAFTQARNASLSPDGTFQIEQADLQLTAANWSDEYYLWLVQRTDGGYTTLDIINSDPSNLSLWIVANGGWEEFIVNHANNQNKVFVRIVSTESSTMLTIDGDKNGELEYTYIDSSNQSHTAKARAGSRISISEDAVRITQLKAIADDYYSFVSFQLIGTTDTPANETFTPSDGILVTADAEAPELFSLENFKMQGFTITVSFTPTVYRFNVATSFGESKPVAELVTHNGGPTGEAVSLGGNVGFQASALAVDGYKFTAWKVLTSAGEEIFRNETEFELGMDNIDILFLMQYVVQGKITVTAVYVETFMVSVFFESGQSEFGTLAITIVDGVTNESKSFVSPDSFEVVAGTTMDITASPLKYYDFGAFLNKTTGQKITTSTMRLTITASTEITVTFVNKAFEIVFEAWEQQKITGANGEYYTVVNGELNESGMITVGDRLDSAHVVDGTSLPGFRFTGFTIKNTQGNPINFTNASLADGITMQIMRANFNLADQFVIVANYVRSFTVKVEIAELSQGMGTFAVYKNYTGVNDTPTNETEFDAGSSIVTIIATPYRFHRLNPVNPFGSIAPEEIDAENPNRINLTSSRSVTIRFVSQTFDLEAVLTASQDGQLSADKTMGLAINRSVTLTASPPSGKVIKKWTINNYTIEELAAMPELDITILGNDVKFMFSLEWYDKFGLELTSNVDFKLSTAVLLAIILPSVLIPLLAAATAWYLIQSKKKYAAIKAELTKEMHTKRALDPTQFIKDLKEGKSGEITKEDIKKKKKSK